MSIMPPSPDGKLGPRVHAGELVHVPVADGSFIGEAVIVGTLHTFVRDGNGTARWFDTDQLTRYTAPPPRCPRCGYFHAGTRRTPAHLRAATSDAALAFHALQVHHRTIAELRAAVDR